MQVKLRPFQEECLRMIYAFHGCAIVGDEMGLGKTLEYLSWLSKIPTYRPAVIVTLASVKYHWQAEARRIGLDAIVLEGRGDKHAKLQGSIFILNYDILASWLPALKRIKPKAIGFDESQALGNVSTKRTKAAMTLAAGVPTRIGLSGTPITDAPIQFWPILNIIRPDLFPNRMDFAWLWCKPKWTPWGWQFKGAQNPLGLNALLKKELLIRRLKVDVAPELPKKIRRLLPCRLPSYKEYFHAKNDFLSWLRKTNPARANRAARAEAVSKVGYLFRLSARLRLPLTIQYVKEFFETHPGEKLMCLTMHTFVLEAVCEAFKKRHVFVNGTVAGMKRQEAVNKFTNDRSCDLFVGQWRAAGAGLNLQVARHGAGLDFPWTPGVQWQGEDRLHRIGQTREVYMDFLFGLNTIEENWWKVLQKKSEPIQAIMDGRASQDNTETAFDELLKLETT